jgi:UPF0042 nucleotide-binding protein
VVDVRHHFKDPHVDPALRYLTAADPPVMAAVLGTPGIPGLIRSIVDMAHAYWCAPRPDPLTIAIGCAGGRHRSAAVAIEAARLLELDGAAVSLVHRDLSRPVIERPSDPGRASKVVTGSAIGCGPPALYPHFCRIPACRTAIDADRLMCALHWYQVPRPLRDEIWRLSLTGPAHLYWPTSEEWYLDAIERAIEAVSGPAPEPVAPRPAGSES